ncbi:MAG: phosphatase [Epsilonproteobacteria bacterium]|nr:MAG: phosphatase [Campylobacterota bacterium]RLA62946.1 MAG: phosphatase [Campylobacterota bacterium]
MFKVISMFSILLSFSLSAEVDHIRVLFQERPYENVVVAFTQFGKSEEQAVVYFDEVSRSGKIDGYAKKQNFNIKRLYHGQNKAFVVARKLTGLKPATNYYFTIKVGNVTSREYYFKTAPKDLNAQFKLLFGGDSRSDRVARKSMNHLIRDLVQKNGDILALVHGGDMVWDGAEWDEFSVWLSDHVETIGRDGKILPLIVARGNHEKDALLFQDIFVLENHLSDAYYVTQMGKLLLFNLNTNISHKGNQRKWLLSKLEELPKEHNWLLANYHRPAWPAVKSPGRALKYWVPIFEKYQFDLVFESDGHVLKKTQPIFERQLDYEKGIIYVGEGGMGVKLRRPRTNKWYLEGPGYATSKYHVFMLDVSSSKMTCSVVLKNQSIYDSFDLNPRKRPLL